MKKSLLEYIVCPNCNGSLGLQGGYKSDGTDVNDGLLCCDSCKSIFPIQNDIPRFVPKDNYTSNFGFQWNLFKKTQLDSQNNTKISRNRFFRQTNWQPEEIKGKIVLDAGCGAGRFAEIALAVGAIVIAIDQSKSVDVCLENLKENNNLYVIEADIYKLPFGPDIFDYIYSFGVLQHTPDPKKAFLNLTKKLKKNGKICVDSYRKDWKIFFWPKYWLRPFTKNLPSEFLFNLIRKIVPFLLPISFALTKVPKIGYYLRYCIPVANYVGIHPLNKQELYEWAVLDTFDMFSPKYDNPQNEKSVFEWLKESGLSKIEVFDNGLVVARGIK